MWMCGLDYAGSGQGPVVEAHGHSNEPLRFIEVESFLTSLATVNFYSQLCINIL
jgi:hypothetical protein